MLHHCSECRINTSEHQGTYQVLLRNNSENGMRHNTFDYESRTNSIWLAFAGFILLIIPHSPNAAGFWRSNMATKADPKPHHAVKSYCWCWALSLFAGIMFIISQGGPPGCSMTLLRSRFVEPARRTIS